MMMERCRIFFQSTEEEQCDTCHCYELCQPFLNHHVILLHQYRSSQSRSIVQLQRVGSRRTSGFII